MTSVASADVSDRRLYTVTTTDHTAFPVIATAVGLAVLPVFGLIRYLIRRATEIGADDILLFVSSAAAIAQSGIILRATTSGLRQSTSKLQADKVAEAEKLYYTSTIFWVLSVAFSKASTASLLLRLGVTKQHRTSFGPMLVFVALWGVASVFALALKCELSQPWRLVEAQCPGEMMRWQVISAFDILFEVVVPFSAAVFVWPLNTATTTKLSVIFAFSFRMPIVVIITIRLMNFPTIALNRDPTLRLDLLIVWSQTQMFWSTISAIIPSLRLFLRGLSTYTDDVRGSTRDPHSQRYANPSGHELSNLRSTASKADPGRRKGQKQWRRESGGAEAFLDAISKGIRSKEEHHTSVHRTQRDQRNSSDSQNMIIQKDVQFTVAYG